MRLHSVRARYTCSVTTLRARMQRANKPARLHEYTSRLEVESCVTARMLGAIFDPGIRAVRESGKSKEATSAASANEGGSDNVVRQPG